MWRLLRIGILLTILLVVALTAWNSHVRITSWKTSLRVMVYPVNATGDPVTDRYIDTLNAEALRPIAEFMQQQAQRYGLPLSEPISIDLAPKVRATPPAVPKQAGVVDAMLWSLQFRYWAWRNDHYVGPRPHVRLFVAYSPLNSGVALPHSVGLRKGMLGLVNVFASRSMQSENNVVIAHELLHTFGASDKYDPLTNQPRYPDGYAEPSITPLYPQQQAEIMAGRIAITQGSAAAPSGLSQTMIGPVTAREIHWMK
jgi:hypothetical protein